MTIFKGADVTKFLVKISMTLVFVSVVVSGSVTVAANTPCDFASNTCRVLLGVYYGNQGWDMTNLKAMETWQGKKQATVTLFTDWQPSSMDNLFNIQLLNFWNNKNIPLITWEPFVQSGYSPSNINVLVNNGQYDSYLSLWADRMKVFLSGVDGVYGTADDRRSYLRLAHEMNGNWYPWSASIGNQTPADYINMWLRVRSIFAQKGIENTRLQWIWSVNNEDVGLYQAEEYFPGEEHVDWIGIDGYNFGTSQSWSTWRTSTALFDPMITRLRVISLKPLSINEVGSSTVGGGITAKNNWITTAMPYFANRGVKMISWFNVDKETDWAVYGGINGTTKVGGKKVYAGYKTMVSSPNFVPSSSTDVRLLSDAQFSGQ